MSLREFVELPDVAERLKPFRGTPKASNDRLLVPSRGNPQLAGTAFDYLLRFELQRLDRHAVDGRWVAEQAPLWLGMTPVRPNGPNDEDLAAVERASRAEAVCRAARAALAGYREDAAPNPERRRDIAAWAVRLAKIDGVIRGRGLDPAFEAADPGMVDELLDLLDVVPFEQLRHPETLLLNPDFGPVSRLVGGADADLVTGDALIDFKTTASCEVRANHIDQLLGYFLLARRAGRPAINKVGIYFARHGRLRVRDTAVWTDDSAFAETEAWFFERADKQYPQPKPRVRAAEPKPRGRKKK